MGEVITIPRRTLTPAQQVRVRELWLSGISVLDIARELNCPPYEIDTRES